MRKCAATIRKIRPLIGRVLALFAHRSTIRPSSARPTASRKTDGSTSSTLRAASTRSPQRARRAQDERGRGDRDRAPGLPGGVVRSSPRRCGSTISARNRSRYGPDGRIKLTGLDYVTNDNELQCDPIFNDGYTAPEIYRGKKVDKRADIFSAGALLFTMPDRRTAAVGELARRGRPVRFYPPHVVSPALEHVIRRALLSIPGERWPTSTRSRLS